MARHVSDARKEAAALLATRRMIAQGERPLYRVRTDATGRWGVEGYPWLAGKADSRGAALEAAVVAIATWIDVDPIQFDIERFTG